MENLPVGAAHATTNNNVVPLKLSSRASKNDNAQVICEQVNRIVSRHCDSNLELPRQED